MEEIVDKARTDSDDDTRFLLSTIMSAPAASRGSSISHHLRATKEILRDAIFNAKYVHSGEVNRIRTKIRASRVAVIPDKTAVRPTN